MVRPIAARFEQLTVQVYDGSDHFQNESVENQKFWNMSWYNRIVTKIPHRTLW